MGASVEEYKMKKSKKVKDPIPFKRYTGRCNTPCNVVTGECVCGQYHTRYDWEKFIFLREVQLEKQEGKKSNG